MSLTLVNKGKPRRLSGPEIQALTAERVAARQKHYAEEREKRESEINYSERLEFYGYGRRKPLLAYCVGMLGVAFLGAWMADTLAKAVLGLVMSLALMGLAIYLSTRRQ